MIWWQSAGRVGEESGEPPGQFEETCPGHGSRVWYTIHPVYYDSCQFYGSSLSRYTATGASPSPRPSTAADRCQCGARPPGAPYSVVILPGPSSGSMSQDPPPDPPRVPVSVPTGSPALSIRAMLSYAFPEHTVLADIPLPGGARHPKPERITRSLSDVPALHQGPIGPAQLSRQHASLPGKKRHVPGPRPAAKPSA